MSADLTGAVQQNGKSADVTGAVQQKGKVG